MTSGCVESPRCQVNGQFPRTDVALVVGANDVVNPAARTSPGSPIFGMPILDVDLRARSIFLKRSMRPGFAGIETELLYDAEDHLALWRRQGLALPRSSRPIQAV